MLPPRSVPEEWVQNTPTCPTQKRARGNGAEYANYAPTQKRAQEGGVQRGAFGFTRIAKQSWGRPAVASKIC